MEKLKRIRLGGKLGAKFGREHFLAVGSVAEAVRALGILFPGFQQHLMDSPNPYAVFIGKQNIEADRLRDPVGIDEIRLMPIPAGSKSGGLFAVIVGAVLVVAGVATANPALVMAGVGMAVGGAVMMLSPQTTGIGALDSAENRPSYAFNGPVNTAAQGNPVPIAYGELIIGSMVISGGMYSEDRSA